MDRHLSNSPVFFAERDPVLGSVPEEAPRQPAGRGREDCWMPGTFLVNPNWFEVKWHSDRPKRVGLTSLAMAWLRVSLQGVAHAVAGRWQRRDRWGLANQPY